MSVNQPPPAAAHLSGEALPGAAQIRSEANSSTAQVRDAAAAAASSPARPQQLSRARQYFSLGILLLLSVFAFIDRSIIALMVNPIKAELHISDFQVGLLQGFAFAFFYAVCAVPIGWALDRYPRRAIVYAGVTLWSLAAAACGLAKGYSQLLVARFGVGVGEATLTPASYSMLSEIFPKERLTTALAVYSLGASMGSALAMLLGGLVVDLAEREAFTPLFGDMAPWRIVFIITGLPGLVLSFLIFLIPDTRKLLGQTTGAKPQLSEAVAFLRRRRSFLTCHFLGFGCMALLAFAISSWMPTYLIRNYGWTGGQAGAAMAATAVLSGLGVLLNGVIAEAMLRRGIKDAHLRYYMWAAIAAGTLGLLAFQMPSALLTIAVGAVATALSAMSGVAAGALQLIAAPRVRGLVSALYLLVIGLLGSGAGPVVVAAITDFVLRDESKVGQSISITFAVVAPIAVICFFFGRRHMKAAIVDLQSSTP